ncbi:hypothetical protein MT390_05625 [Vibrio sp. 2-Bac 85]
MQLPSIPTDNLYKFLSISGLWIFFIFIFIPEYIIYITSEKIRNIELNGVILSIESSALSKESREIEYLLKLEENKLKAEIKTNEELDAIKSTGVILNDRNDKVSALIKNSKIAMAKHKIKLDEVKYYLTRLNFLKFIQNYGMFFGFCMSLIGFISWYFKIQRIEDKLRAKQVQKKYMPQAKSRFLSIRKNR